MLYIVSRRYIFTWKLHRPLECVSVPVTGIYYESTDKADFVNFTVECIEHRIGRSF